MPREILYQQLINHIVVIATVILLLNRSSYSQNNIEYIDVLYSAENAFAGV